MVWIQRATTIIRRFLRQRQAEEDLDEEVHSWFEISVEAEMAKGLSRAEAQRAVRLRSGGPEQVKYTVRHSWTGAWIRSLLQDLHYAWMALKKRPGYTVTAIGTLALGIGANTVIFSVVSGVLLRPLPFAHPDRLVQVNEYDPAHGPAAVSYPDLQKWRQQSSSFEEMIAYGNSSKDLQGAGEPERVRAVWAERGLFHLLGTQPLLGRTFRGDDPLHVAVLSAGLWRSRFEASASCIGRKLILDGEPYTVIGVMPEQFEFPFRNSRTQVWIPWEAPRQFAGDRAFHVDFVAARLRDQVPVAMAARELRDIDSRAETSYRKANRSGAQLTFFSEIVTGDVRPALLTLLGAVGMVLLIACANVMNLLLTRMAGRRHELAIRCALGAGRHRLIQQLLTESVLVSTLGGAAGLLLALGGSRVLLTVASTRIPRSWEIGLDWRVFCFLAAVSVGAGILFGLAPALAVSQIEVRTGLNDVQGSRSAGFGSSTWTGRRLRESLVIAEITMAFLLLIGTGLLGKAFLHLRSTPTGLVTDRVLTLHMSLGPGDFSGPGAWDRYLRQVEQRVAQVPGVRAVGCIQYLPLRNWGWTGGFAIAGHIGDSAQEEARAELRFVTPGYFRAFGIPLHRGRFFNEHDTSDSQPVIVINEALARRYFPNENAIGKRTDRGLIVGVAGDVRQSGLDRPAAPEIYYEFAQNAAATPDAGVSLAVSTFDRPENVAASVRDAIHRVNPRQALFDIEPMDRVIAESISDLKLYVWLIGLFAGVALVLAIAGIYGVISYAVAARTGEFGIRVALGAHRGSLFRLVLWRGSMLVISGLISGVAGALALTRTLKSFVEGVTSLDPWVFGVVSLVLGAVAMLACCAPARRAARVDPNVALQYE